MDCPECSAVFWQAQACPNCGWRRRIKPDAVEVQDGDLVPLDRGQATGLGLQRSGQAQLSPAAAVDQQRARLQAGLGRLHVQEEVRRLAAEGVARGSAAVAQR